MFTMVNRYVIPWLLLVILVLGLYTAYSRISLKSDITTLTKDLNDSKAYSDSLTMYVEAKKATDEAFQKTEVQHSSKRAIVKSKLKAIQEVHQNETSSCNVNANELDRLRILTEAANSAIRESSN